MFKPSDRDVFSWSVPDAEFGEMMNGHILLLNDGYVLVDPPMAPDLVEDLSVFGKCLGIISLGPAHKRGAMTLASMLKTNLFVPDFAVDAFGGSSETVKSYGNGSSLPGNLKAMELQTKIGIFGDHKIHEMALTDEKNRAFVADACYAFDGKMNVAPEGIMPNFSHEQASASFGEVYHKLGSKMTHGFFGHGVDLKGNFGAEIERRKKEFTLK